MKALLLIYLAVAQLWVQPSPSQEVTAHFNKGPSGKAFVKSCSHDIDFQTESTITCVFGSNITAGNAVVCGVYWTSSVVTLVSVTGSSDTFTVNGTTLQLTGVTVSSAVQFTSVGGYTTLTATFSASSSITHMMACHEVSGGATAVDASNIRNQAAPGHTADAITSNSFTTTSNGDYIFGFMVDNNATGDATAHGTGYTERVNLTTLPMVTEDKIQSSSGAITVTFTDSGTGFASTFCMGIGLK